MQQNVGSVRQTLPLSRCCHSSLHLVQVQRSPNQSKILSIAKITSLHSINEVLVYSLCPSNGILGHLVFGLSL